MKYQPIFYTLYFRLHLARVLNNILLSIVIEMVEIADGRVEQVRYVVYNLLHLVIVKYGVISLLVCTSTRIRLMKILSLLVK